ncbi:hypothetical protein PR048_019800 [Dryococelus australis]|uniref:Uncharacterized protein n=1 Tax=Dryococelus australis TaxID=614101 RepID=A0ABQ9H4H5_9NEOP|nr:hypothetical protein PR048_019800 [Dryococelus australis]
MKQRRNARAVETGDPRENSPISSIVRHDSHVRKSGSDPAGYRTRYAVGEAGSLTATSPRPPTNTVCSVGRRASRRRPPPPHDDDVSGEYDAPTSFPRGRTGRSVSRSHSRSLLAPRRGVVRPTAVVALLQEDPPSSVSSEADTFVPEEARDDVSTDLGIGNTAVQREATEARWLGQRIA